VHQGVFLERTLELSKKPCVYKAVSTKQDSQDDIELMLAVKADDSGAFDELVRRHHRPLVGFFCRLCYRMEEAEDLTQDTLMKLYAGRARYKPIASFGAYLYTIARTVWIDACRKKKRRPKLWFFGGKKNAAALAVEQKGAPDANMMTEEALAGIDCAMQKLSEEHRMAVLLSIGGGLKYAEIAQIMKVPVGTVRSRMHYALQILRDELKEMGIQPK